MKQKCHFQKGVTQHRNVAMPLSSEHLRHQYHTLALSNKVYNFISTQGAQKLSAIKASMCRFH